MLGLGSYLFESVARQYYFTTHIAKLPCFSICCCLRFISTTFCVKASLNDSQDKLFISIDLVSHCLAGTNWAQT